MAALTTPGSGRLHRRVNPVGENVTAPLHPVFMANGMAGCLRQGSVLTCAARGKSEVRRGKSRPPVASERGSD